MLDKRIGIIILIFLVSLSIQGQVKIRLLTEVNPDYFFFKVKKGSYRIHINDDPGLKLIPGDLALVSRYNDKLLIKTRGRTGILADSVCFRQNSGDDEFGVSTTSGEYLSASYAGNLICTPDFGGILLINNCRK